MISLDILTFFRVINMMTDIIATVPGADTDYDIFLQLFFLFHAFCWFLFLVVVILSFIFKHIWRWIRLLK